MFTGLIEELGSVRGRVRRGAFQQLEIEAERVLDDLQVGDSVNINGACQTAVAIGESGFSVETVAETLARTTLGTLGIGQAVNLERALRADQRLGGHLVLGHVDGVARIRRARSATGSIALRSSRRPRSLATSPPKAQWPSTASA